jgi:RimJ/RimL family protein N-acetyltransferase
MTGERRPLELRPVTLEGEHVRLEPVSPEHIQGLLAAGRDESIWRWMPRRPVTRDDFQSVVEHAIAEQQHGRGLTWATVHRATGEVVGSTSFLNVSAHDNRLEIGATWITPTLQRTAINTEAKYLQLRHCFEDLGCLRVELKTDARNLNSQRAIERIGAVREGVFRKHMRTQGGFQRDSVYFSITDDEWSGVKRRLEIMLGR